MKVVVWYLYLFVIFVTEQQPRRLQCGWCNRHAPWHWWRQTVPHGKSGESWHGESHHCYQVKWHKLISMSKPWSYVSSTCVRPAQNTNRVACPCPCPCQDPNLESLGLWFFFNFFFKERKFSLFFMHKN